MGTTKTTQIGQLVKAIVNQKPSEFNDTFKTIFKDKIDTDIQAVQDDLQKNAFKSGEHETDFETVTGRKQPEPEENQDHDDASKDEIDTQKREEENIIDMFIGGLNKSIEDMHKDDANRSLSSDTDAQQEYSDAG